MDVVRKYTNRIGRHNVTNETLIFRSDFHKCRKIIRAITARILLIAHAIFAIWLVTRVNPNYFGFYAACGIIFFIETVTILYYRYGCEWERVCTCFICYLGIVVPVLWLLRLDQISKSINKDLNNGTVKDNSTVELYTQDDSKSEYLNDLLSIPAATRKSIVKKVFENAASYVEQSMMFFIIICRWLLPRGRIDRNTISQLLIMYSATSADILDFSDIINQEPIQNSSFAKYIVLGVWSWSLIQFIVVITTSFVFRKRQGQHDAGNKASVEKSENRSEKLSILMIFFMQDGPFLATRIYVVFWLRAFDDQIIFFSLKNVLTIILAMYRLLVLNGCVSKEGNDLLRKSEIARSLESLDDIDAAEVAYHSKKFNKKNKKQKAKESRY
ncbi:hypothetical protein ACF0H5_015025 [Mactra antiquata]